LVDVISWIRKSRTDIIKVVFKPSPIGIIYKKNRITAVNPGSPAAEAQIYAGFHILSVNGNNVQNNTKQIKEAIEATNQHGLDTTILFQCAHKDLPVTFNTCYGPMEEAVISMLLLSTMYDFLQSQFWIDAQLARIPKITILWQVLENNVTLYSSKDCFKVPHAYIKSGSWISGEIDDEWLRVKKIPHDFINCDSWNRRNWISGIKDDDWIFVKKGYIQLRNNGKWQLRQCKVMKKMHEISPLSDSNMKLLKEATAVINSYQADENWLKNMQKVSDYLPIPISVVDCMLPDCPLVYVNPTFTKMTEYDAKECIGKNCRFLQGEDKGNEKNLFARNVIRENFSKEAYVHLINYTKSGVRFQNLLSMKTLHDTITDEQKYVLGIQFFIGNEINDSLMTPDLIIFHTLNILDLYQINDESDVQSQDNDCE